MKLTQEQLKDILEKHAKWCRGEYGGKRADLADAYLDDAYLTGAVLIDADLTDAVLTGADLSRPHGCRVAGQCRRLGLPHGGAQGVISQ